MSTVGELDTRWVGSKLFRLDICNIWHSPHPGYLLKTGRHPSNSRPDFLEASTWALCRLGRIYSVDRAFEENIDMPFYVR